MSCLLGADIKTFVTEHYMLGVIYISVHWKFIVALQHILPP